MLPLVLALLPALPTPLPALRPALVPAARAPKWTAPLPKAALAAALVVGASQPAMAAKAAAVPFTLLGRSSFDLFPVQNLSLLSWLLYLFLPRWSLTPTLALIPPVVHSGLYAAVLAHMIRNPAPGIAASFSSLSGIMPFFTLPDGVFAGWLHYCTFDPLVGLGIVLDAKRTRIPHLLCIPCLAATLLMGPVGFLSYLLLRTTVKFLRRQGVLAAPRPPPSGFAWGKSY